ncbi:hypothetical protein CNMCM5623_006758 [Aspergillus felis]|uniref:Uncharacterized protein n=1 Tax=Aspergillus felis TaxID=1287682 RepID=A0A8H6V1K4_9EURO|nr:hypothetical protein CNMCM5623_006758 [Aspergillus felis]
MPLTPLNNYDASQAGTWERSPSYCPTPGDFGRERTASEYSFSPHGEHSTPLPQSQSGGLRFHDQVESDDGATGDEHPSYIPYIIEWRVTLNNRVLAKDMEQDLDSTPSSYWQQIKQKAERVLRQKINRNRRVKPDDTSVVVSVNDRSQRDLTKRFEKTDIDWTAINRQIRMWQDLLCLPKKKLTVSISINYMEDADSPPRKTDKRGNSSVTNRILRERDDQIDAENYSGEPSVWRDVYQKMRCPGPPCQHEGQYCWQDPIGKKHYRLRTHHLKTIVKYMEQGGILDTHDDVPDNVREQLYAEEHHRLLKQNKSPNAFATGSTLPPININVLPTQSSQPSLSSSSGTEASMSSRADYADIPGPLEAVVEEYANWHLSRVSSDSYKENIKKARDIALENCFDLGQIQAEDPDFFVKQGVKIGAARRFVGHIRLWLEEKENGSG